MSGAVIDRFKRAEPALSSRSSRSGKKRVSTSLRLFRLLRRNRSLALAGALLLALAAGWQTGTFAVARDQAIAFAGDTAAHAGLVVGTIELVGLEQTSEAEMIRALGVATGDPMLSLDIAVARARAEALPWVREAAIARRLPDTLSVIIQERVPFALWQLDGTLWLMDETGTRITKRIPGRYTSLPMVVGAGAGEAAAELFAMLAEEPGLSAQVRAAVRVGNRRWNLEFRNGVRLMLPEATSEHNPRAAWSRFADLQRRYGLLEREVTVLDMRLGDRLVLKPTPEGKKIMRADRHRT